VFDDDRNILLMGDVEIEPLLKVARTMLATANRITPHLDWGSFVHMTLQIPEGNVIIAPYHENHLCILTTRTINIGHIRRILRDLQQDRTQGIPL
jgi:predicted regulator of Ras-like GTPase activity (Roadblock/LC7/MglB family)